MDSNNKVMLTFQHKSQTYLSKLQNTSIVPEMYFQDNIEISEACRYWQRFSITFSVKSKSIKSFLFIKEKRYQFYTIEKIIRNIGFKRLVHQTMVWEGRTLIQDIFNLWDSIYESLLPFIHLSLAKPSSDSIYYVIILKDLSLKICLVFSNFKDYILKFMKEINTKKDVIMKF